MFLGDIRPISRIHGHHALKSDTRKEPKPAAKNVAGTRAATLDALLPSATMLKLRTCRT